MIDSLGTPGYVGITIFLILYETGDAKHIS